MEAYVFVIFGGDRYIPGVLVGSYSLKMTGTTREIICMVTHDVSQEGIDLIKIYVDKVIKIDYIIFKARMRTKGQQQKYHNISQYFTKFSYLGLKGYKKVIYMDASTVVVKNIDHLFKRKYPTAVFALSKSERGKKILTVQDMKNRFDLKNKDVPHFRFSGGQLLVVEPSPKLLRNYIRMLETMEDKFYKMYPNYFSGPDELTLCYFMSIYKKGPQTRWSLLDKCYAYNYNKFKDVGGSLPVPCLRKDISIMNVSGWSKAWEKKPTWKPHPGSGDMNTVYFWYRIYNQILEDNPDMKHHPGVQKVKNIPSNYPYKSLIKHLID